MYRMSGFFCCALFLLSVSHSPSAATVFRCEDQHGHITFTLQGCPTDQLLDIQSAENPTPGSGKPVSMATVTRPTSVKTSQTKPVKELTVVAEQQDGCGNQVIGTQRRTAIIRQQVRTGMTRADVESALGKPDAQTSTNGETRYLYKTEDGPGRKITFDQDGCVKSKH